MTNLLCSCYWDDENRLTKVDYSDSSLETYTYSADGLRHKKVANASTVFYVLDGDNVLIETDGSLVTQAVYTDLPGEWGGKFFLWANGWQLLCPNGSDAERSNSRTNPTASAPSAADADGFSNRIRKSCLP